MHHKAGEHTGEQVGVNWVWGWLFPRVPAKVPIFFLNPWSRHYVD